MRLSRSVVMIFFPQYLYFVNLSSFAFRVCGEGCTLFFRYKSWVFSCETLVRLQRRKKIEKKWQTMAKCWRIGEVRRYDFGTGLAGDWSERERISGFSPTNFTFANLLHRNVWWAIYFVRAKEMKWNRRPNKSVPFHFVSHHSSRRRVHNSPYKRIHVMMIIALSKCVSSNTKALRTFVIQAHTDCVSVWKGDGVRRKIPDSLSLAFNRESQLRASTRQHPFFSGIRMSWIRRVCTFAVRWMTVNIRYAFSHTTDVIIAYLLMCAEMKSPSFKCAGCLHGTFHSIPFFFLSFLLPVILFEIVWWKTAIFYPIKSKFSGNKMRHPLCVCRLIYFVRNHYLFK